MKRRFRKVYIICSDNLIFGKHNYDMINLYRELSYAESVRKSQQANADSEVNKQYVDEKTPKKLSVHAFYLVHESYFDGEE